jgi:hypothetical protein
MKALGKVANAADGQLCPLREAVGSLEMIQRSA